MVVMRFDYRDIFRSARLAFSFQRIWIQFVGLLYGYLGYIILTYLSLLIDGKDYATGTFEEVSASEDPNIKAFFK